MNVTSTGSGSADPDRIAQLMSQAGQNVTDQHLVSQVLLREWTTPVQHAPVAHLQPYDLQSPGRQLKTRPPRGVGWIKNFVPWASASLEAKWGTVEQNLPDVLAQVKAGKALEDRRATGILRDLIALHYIRSHYFREAFNRVFTDFVPRRRQWLIEERPHLLTIAFEQHTGRAPSGPEDLEAIADEIFSPMIGQYQDGSLLRVRIDASFEQARQLMSRYELQIVEPLQSEFLIGDNPALTLRRAGDNILHSMALHDSRTTVLPIGPHHMLALGDTSFHALVSKSAVDTMNMLQIEAARRYVYARPGSQLDPIIEEVSCDRLADNPPRQGPSCA
ncbi:DUF4238 domain-containing protein [Streptomyces sp. NPDC005244]|uniref:DUF4238 domain-containing protein n=1 Tax=Streptomyces sp. NPDC005244 TaxID=3364708 RepID=UPI0036CA4C40